MLKMGLGERESHLYAGPSLGIGPIKKKCKTLTPAHCLSICPITGKGHIYSDYISPILEIA